MKHTKGPWKVHKWEITVGTDFYHIRSGQQSNRLIATIHRWQGHIDKREALANAKLIAAAPDLLEACYWAIAFGKNGAVHDKMIIEKLETAIKKATE